MFHTNISELERKMRCDDDCVPSGCPGHIFKLKVYSTSGTGAFLKDDVPLVYFDCNSAEALFSMFKQLEKNG
jgi:hypothetical protein